MAGVVGPTEGDHINAQQSSKEEVPASEG
jgi:hypothetical protein